MTAVSSTKAAINKTDRLTGIVRKIKDDRRRLHAHPEVAFQEFQTFEYIRRRLKELEIPVMVALAETGLVATIEGQGNSKRAIGLRADMDALPLKEANGFDQRPLVEGVIHACGHDGHVSILLGVAEMLAKERDFDGKVHLIFQPAEERHSGARKMIEEELFNRFPMDRVFALHNWPGLPAGYIGTLKGRMLRNKWISSIQGYYSVLHSPYSHSLLSPRVCWLVLNPDPWVYCFVLVYKKPRVKFVCHNSAESINLC